MSSAPGHGGKRRRHVLPSLSTRQVQLVRLLRLARVPYKRIERMLGVGRDTLSRAVNGRRTYRGY